MLARRPLVPSAVAFLVSLSGWLAVVLTHRASFWQQIDASAFRAAGSYVFHANGRLYDTPLGIGRLHYIYPPFGALVFAPFAWLPFAVWKAATLVINVALLGYCADVSLRLAGVERRTDRAAGALIVAALSLWLEPVESTLGFGQTNLILLALILADLAAPARTRWRGVRLGLAAGIKLTPLLFIPYLFFVRQRRAAVVAAATFLATVVVGAILLPRDAGRYWFHNVVGTRLDISRFANQSFDGLALRVTHAGAGAHALWLLLVVMFGVPAFALAVVAGRRGQLLLGACLCGLAGLLVSPMTWSHHWVWALPALVYAGVAAVRRPGLGWVGGATLLVVFGWWPAGVGALFGREQPGGWTPVGLIRLAPNGNGAELHWTAAETVYGNAYVLAGAATVLAVAVAFSRRRTSRPRAGPRTPA